MSGATGKKSSKDQDPSSREAPSSKSQAASKMKAEPDGASDSIGEPSCFHIILRDSSRRAGNSRRFLPGRPADLRFTGLRLGRLASGTECQATGGLRPPGWRLSLCFPLLHLFGAGCWVGCVCWDTVPSLLMNIVGNLLGSVKLIL